MRRILLPGLLLPLLAMCQRPGQTLLWKVEGNGLAAPSYVVGTMHSRDARVFGQAGSLLRILSEQDGMVGELDLTAAPGMQAELAVSMLLPPGQELSAYYTRRQLHLVRQCAQRELGAMALLTARMKPFYLMALLGEVAMGGDSAQVLDQWLQEKAAAMGKPVTGLETMQEQMAAVDALPLQQQADMLLDLVKHDLYRADMEEMLDAYAAADLGRLAKTAMPGTMPEAVEQGLVMRRNAVMAQRLDSLLRTGRTFLVAVGAAHLPGEDGLLELLRRKGYHVAAAEPPVTGTVREPQEWLEDVPRPWSR